MCEALSVLAKFAREDEWRQIGKVLSPEIHQPVTKWDSLSSSKRGELAGYALGKHGADIVVPETLAKVASRSMKYSGELSTVLKTSKQLKKRLSLKQHLA